MWDFLGQASLLPRWAKWLALVLLAATITPGLQAMHLPASQLLGPMLAGILVGVFAGGIRLPRLWHVGAQSIVGCLIATLVTPGIIVAFVHDWPVIMAAVVATLLASGALGWLMMSWRVLPGTTAIWGAAPGGAAAMVVMAEAFGADIRLVALMQYMRVAGVAVTAALLAHWLAGGLPASVPVPPMFPAIEPLAFASTLVLAALGGFIGRRFRVPAGPLLLPLVFGAVLHGAGLVDLQIPRWLITLCYAVIGCSIGLGFTRPVLVLAAAALPRIIFTTVVLIGFCGLVSLVLMWELNIDALTAFLAMSPGGLDSIAAIGAASHVDMSFVMALQTARLILVILIAPPLARFLSDRFHRSAQGFSPAAGD
ncbi:AbrB family transcriptional regulator [Humitalea sp. 24SJ18S-53]|uniref:AbrB family transcriptional regulator n=1 Tax=Humitalea sp. 24SJ18S-53 TaxID=3422307 RepID=UPI003D66FC3F